MANFRKKHLVTKSNNLVGSPGSWSIWERRLFAFMLTKLSYQSDEFEPIEIYFADLMLMFRDPRMKGSAAGSYYDNIKDAAKSLYEKSVTYNAISSDGVMEVVNMRLLSSTRTPEAAIARLLEETRNGYIKLTFNGELKKDLLFLKKNFTSYNLIHAAQLKTSYAFALYEIAKRYQGLGEFKKDMNQIRVALSMLVYSSSGEIESDSYSKPSQLKRVLDRSVKAINSTTDIVLSYEFGRGRGANRKIAFQVSARKISLYEKIDWKGWESIPSEKYVNALPEDVLTRVLSAFAKKGKDKLLRNKETFEGVVTRVEQQLNIRFVEDKNHEVIFEFLESKGITWLSKDDVKIFVNQGFSFEEIKEAALTTIAVKRAGKIKVSADSYFLSLLQKMKDGTYMKVSKDSFATPKVDRRELAKFEQNWYTAELLHFKSRAFFNKRKIESPWLEANGFEITDLKDVKKKARIYLMIHHQFLDEFQEVIDLEKQCSSFRAHHYSEKVADQSRIAFDELPEDLRQFV